MTWLSKKELSQCILSSPLLRELFDQIVPVISPKVATLLIFLLWPNTKQKQPSGVVALFRLRFPEASVHSHLSVCSWAFPWSMEASLRQKHVEEETVCVMASRNQTEKGTRHNLTGHTPNDLLPPARPYFLKLPKAPKIAQAVGESNIQQTHPWKPVHIRTTTAAWDSNCWPKYDLTHLPQL